MFTGVIFIEIRIASNNGSICGLVVSSKANDFLNALALYLCFLTKKASFYVKNNILVVRYGPSTGYFFEISAESANILKDRAKDPTFTIMDTITEKGIIFISLSDTKAFDLESPLKEIPLSLKERRELLAI